MTDKKLRNVYDDWSAIYDTARIGGYFKNNLNIVVNHIPPGNAVLDVGCGTGMYSIELAKRGYRVKGLDISEKMVSKARNNAAKAGVKVEFTVANVEDKVPFKDKFDYAICLGSWEYFVNPVSVLTNIGNSLKPGGRFIITTANPYYAPMVITAEKLKIKKLAPTYVYFNSFANRVKKWAEQASYTLQKKEHSYYFFNVVFHLKKQ